MNEQQSSQKRWVRDYIFDILRQLEIGCIFGVPGTNEIPIIDGCDTPENRGKVRYIECLHENIAMGAAMGYARMTGKPGIVELHVTPGIGHALGNLYNAKKSKTPLIILCGQQQNELVTQEPLLASNLVQVAGQYTKWSHELRSWEEAPLVLQRAFKEAMATPAGPVFLSFPWDFLIHEIDPDAHIPGVTRIASRFAGDEAEVKRAVDLLVAAKNPVIIAGDSVGYSDAGSELQELAALVGAPVYLEGFSSLINFPNSDPHWQGELPGDQNATRELLTPHDVAFMCGFGNQAQLAVFKYSDGPLIPSHIHQIYLDNNSWDIGKNHYGEAAILGDVKTTLRAINRAVAAQPPPGADERNKNIRAAAAKRSAEWQAYVEATRAAEQIQGALVADSLRELIVEKGLQKRFVYVHEAVSDSPAFQLLMPFGELAAPTSYYCVGGGSLGWSMPASLGIKLALREAGKDEPTLVINAVGDGSSLFYPQVYWTAAHQGLPVLYVVMNNREYHTLQVGLQQVVKTYGDAPAYGWTPVTMTPDYLTIKRPELDFTALARAFGVAEGRIVAAPRDVKEALRVGINHVLETRTSYVIDMRIDPDDKKKPTVPEEPAVDAYFQHYLRAPKLGAAATRHPRKRFLF